VLTEAEGPLAASGMAESACESPARSTTTGAAGATKIGAGCAAARARMLAAAPEAAGRDPIPVSLAVGLSTSPFKGGVPAGGMMGRPPIGTSVRGRRESYTGKWVA
jgi:hypothetical protein